MTAAVRLAQAVTVRGLLTLALTCVSLPLISLAATLSDGAVGDLPCETCHDPITEEVPASRFAESVHGIFACADCHSEVTEFPHGPAARQVDCAVCHDATVTEYDSGIHGRARANGHTRAAGCLDCHGDIHAVTPHTERTSSVHWTHLAESCARCHSDPTNLPEGRLSLARPVDAYLLSVHARLVAEGRRAAVCSDCHGSHAIQRSSDSSSPVNHARVPDTCGQCHSDIAATFAASIHGRAAAQGIREAPVCTDCHGEHRILSPAEPGSPVFPTNVSLQTCGHCHSDVRLNRKYGLPEDRVPAYTDTYHGLASRLGVQTVANCASCHGMHDIQPSSDARSHVHPTRLAETCGQCHPGAGRRFGIGKIHFISSEVDSGIVFYIRLLYLPLIFVTIGLMALHNLLDLRRKAQRMSYGKLTVTHPSTTETPERMNSGFRFAHYLVMMSFPVLVYTGFALTYPEQWWAVPVNALEAGYGARGWLHRISGLVLLGSIVFHFVHLALDRRARECILLMRPERKDLSELRHRLLYYFGRTVQPPIEGRVSYIEKSEYLAFLWGMAIMGLTGLLLWFESFSLRWFPTWILDAATAVHFYEAILAALAILVWHLYWVIFDPAVYPMDWSWLTGRAPHNRAHERGETSKM